MGHFSAASVHLAPVHPHSLHRVPLHSSHAGGPMQVNRLCSNVSGSTRPLTHPLRTAAATDASWCPIDGVGCAYSDRMRAKSASGISIISPCTTPQRMHSSTYPDAREPETAWISDRLTIISIMTTPLIYRHNLSLCIYRLQIDVCVPTPIG